MCVHSQRQSFPELAIKRVRYTHHTQKGKIYVCVCDCKKKIGQRGHSLSIVPVALFNVSLSCHDHDHCICPPSLSTFQRRPFTPTHSNYSFKHHTFIQKESFLKSLQPHEKVPKSRNNVQNFCSSWKIKMSSKCLISIVVKCGKRKIMFIILFAT